MELPHGFDLEQKNGKVCRLKKSCAWFGRFTKAIQQHGYKQARANHILFYRSLGEKIMILVAYVDDIIVIGE